MSKYLVFYLEIFLILVIPIILFMKDSQFLASRPIVMALGGLYCSWRLWSRRATLASLGIHRAQFGRAIRALAFPSFILIITIYLLFYLLPHNILQQFVGYDPLKVSSMSSLLLSYILFSVPIQELIFRGYFTWRLKQVFISPQIIRLFSVVIFTAVHIPFYNPFLLLASFAMGLLYIYNYQKYQNIFALMISHSLVGVYGIIIRNAWFPYI